MGQQQLLYIILAVILIGLSVIFGITLFNNYSVQSKKDAIVDELSTLGNMAQQHYSKPAMLGGGGKSFANWNIPVNLRSTPNADYTIKSQNANQVLVEAISSEMLTGDIPIKYNLQIDPNDFQITDITGGS